MTDKIMQTVSTVNAVLSDYVLIFLLCGAGLYFTVITRFVQIRYFKAGLHQVLGNFAWHGKNSSGGLTPYQALTTAIASQVGTGNIVGASGAILTGGPGAIFWMWVIAFFGMATSYAEAVLGQLTRERTSDGQWHGGPVYYLKLAYPGRFGRFLAVFFSAAIIIAIGFMGSMVQANSIGETGALALKVPAWVIGLVISVISGLILLGGVSRLAKVTEKLVPVMAMIYLAGGLVILCLRWRYLPETIGCIFRYAFAPEALLGGSFGHALKLAVGQGAKRGLFSNEAGMGTTPHAHAAAQVAHPHIQGTVAMIGVFLDTIVVLNMTALVVISTLYTGNGIFAGAAGATYTELLHNSGLTKTNLMQYAFAVNTTESAGNLFVALCLLFFAFSTIISWNYFGKVNFQYLFGKKYLPVYSALTVLSIFAGTMMKNDLVWELQDMFNQLMVLPNVLGLAALGSLVRKCALHPAAEIRISSDPTPGSAPLPESE